MVVMDMEITTLKIKVGEHEFEATGPAERVQVQWEAFRDLIQGLGITKPIQAPAEPTQPDAPNLQAPTNGITLDKIMKLDGRIVSLTARGNSFEDELLLLLLGQKSLRNNDQVTGGEIIDGLKQTGRIVVRADYQLDKMSTAGDVITAGVGRARRYRLSNTGFAKAQELARALTSRVA